MVTESNSPKVKRKKINAKLILRAVLVLIFSVVFACGIYTANAKLVFGDDMPMPLGVGLGVIMSGSMEPEYSVDDVIVVVKAKDYAVGDNVVYMSHGMLIVHKIVYIDGDTVITQGTANNVADDPIGIDAIKGRVVTHCDGFGSFIDLVQSPAVTVIILCIAALLIVLSYKSEGRTRTAKNSADLEHIRAEITALKVQQETAAPSEDTSPKSENGE